MILSANDYLGLACDPRVVNAAQKAAGRYGFGSRAARSLGGDTRIHRELECELADFKRTKAALLFGSGFSCNVGVISALAGAGDLICSDQLNHASIVDGCRLSVADVAVYRHNDVEHVDAILERSSAKNIMIVSDAVFSMDGDIAPVPELVVVAKRRGAFLMLDEAHATGVLGESGEGAIGHFDLHGSVEVLMGTLGKALGSVGGFIAGSSDLIDYLSRAARSFVFTTSLPTPAAAAALEALRIVRSEPERVDTLRANTERLKRGLVEAGFEVMAGQTPIVPIRFQNDHVAGEIARLVMKRGVYVQSIGAPYVPQGTSRIRIIASSAHTSDQIDLALEAFLEAKTAAESSQSSRASSAS